MRLKLVFIGFLLLILPNLAGAMDQGCQPENSTEKETHVINGVRCAMDLSMYTNLTCHSWAKSFRVTFSGGKIPGTIIMTCDERETITWGAVSTGNKYTCKWDVKGKPYGKDFEWLRLGSRWKTCSYLKNWVEVSAQ